MLTESRFFASARTDLVTVLLGTWFSIGLFLDAWAHSNLTELESFFTPWHGVYYSGFTATGAWILWLVWRGHRSGRRGLAAIPAGYGPAVVALPTFALFGVGDYVWHTVFGIETDLEIVFSPTHLGLIVAMVVILATPLRTAWLSRDRPTFPALLSLAFCPSLVLIFFPHADATQWSPERIVEAWTFVPGFSQPPAGRLGAAVAITNLIWLLPVLAAARRWRLPFGTATLVSFVIGGLGAVITTGTQLEMFAAFVVGGLLSDVLLVWLKPGEDRLVQYRIYAFASPFVLWLTYFLVAGISAGRMPSVREMWTGAPVVMGCIGLLMAWLMVPEFRHVRENAAEARRVPVAHP
ncbi:hypothetical protein LFM09_45610 [Lentzea alba]|uniref:hypothetical protein n=1 Tax=Lentzea alba TaxID=2714351 RepID=UPI0039BFA449